MLSALFILDETGKPIISRDFRGDIPLKHISRNFINNFLEEDDNLVKPIFIVDSITYVTHKHGDLYLLAVGRGNMNVTTAMVMLGKLVDVFKTYFETVSEESIKDNFALALELLDEMVDFGYAQVYDPSALKTAVFQQSRRLTNVRAMPPPTGAVSWRQSVPPIYYEENKVFCSVVENINYLVAANGTVISSEIKGSIQMDSQLSGMPELHLGLNDKLAFHQSSASGMDPNTQAANRTIDLEDVHFHQCVRLSKFDTNRTISFIPADGKFELMSYRMGKLLKPLFSVTSQSYEFEGSRFETTIHVTTNFKQKSMTKTLSLLIPVPSDVDTPSFETTIGVCQYKPELNCIKWSLGQVNGKKTCAMRAQMGLPTMSSSKPSAVAPPIKIMFEIPLFTVSGIHVRHLTINESSGYTGIPYINYKTQSGEYLVRQDPPKIIKP
ncbi:Adaptor protein complex 1 (AP-1), mu subunit [Blattamonas nauphoetae]|uniref:Adaptor protein complex 1 (AP-1), mu subunit n=1 Tax=Blattamonas nauphoetae TaxID=2049346 RepID=A0ABQ9WT34_9EUKA|nr:Adaptor protein complex 1 (AP-1), mu subunit [Blattamonas nauphoetae]